MATSRVTKVTRGMAREFVEKVLLYRKVKKSIIVGNESTTGYIDFKTRSISDKLNNYLSGDSRLPLTEEEQEALEYLERNKKKHAN